MPLPGRFFESVKNLSLNAFLGKVIFLLFIRHLSTLFPLNNKFVFGLARIFNFTQIFTSPNSNFLLVFQKTISSSFFIFHSFQCFKKCSFKCWQGNVFIYGFLYLVKRWQLVFIKEVVNFLSNGFFSKSSIFVK